ncbi:MAG: enterotoxin, partial [Rhodanobacteraceae bacterium]
MNRYAVMAATIAALCLPRISHAMAAPTDTLPPPWLPSDPGKAHCDVGESSPELANGTLRFAITDDNGGLHPTAFDNRFTSAKHALKGELFSLLLRDGKSIDASRFRLEGALACSAIAAKPDAARRADRLAGIALTASLVDPATGLHVAWRALLRDGTSYVREDLRLESTKSLDLASVSLIDLDLDHAWVDGTASGSPIVADDRFFGFEHPMAEASVIGNRATMTLKRVLPLRAGVATNYSAVFGVVPRGQLRRGFQAYLENERATPFRTFLHYNSWYDIGYFTPYTEAEAVERINAFGQKLVRERGVTMDSFLFDDGWDDHSHLWQFSKDFPHGFTPLEKAAAKYGAAPGVWLSPWGGYGPPRKLRLAAAHKAGYSVDDQGIALSGPKYYQLFHDVTVNLLKKYGINQFKLDGTGSPDKVTPGSAFDSDFAAAIALIHDLRAIKPDLFINLTTNTWPSPFWLRTADSIWRGGWDHSFAGVGDNRQRWITYRDADTYGGIVRQGPLFPLNSLMLHGIIYAQHAKGLDSDPGNDFADEVRSYFATGTGLQEMYIT